jgi:3-isopropylmalate dehydratase small subunit
MLSGTVTSVFGDDVNTDDIIPAMYLIKSDDPEYFATYAFAKFDPDFRTRSLKHQANIIVAGKNFACGSSREQAVYTLQFNRVVCVIARSFPVRVFGPAHFGNQGSLRCNQSFPPGKHGCSKKHPQSGKVTLRGNRMDNRKATP